MSVEHEPVSIRPIGTVISSFKEFAQKTDYTLESTIEIREDLAEALIGLEHFSHIHVIYSQNRRKQWQQHVGWTANEEQILTQPLMGEPSCKGIYTTRSPARPSGMGSCVVELLRREGRFLRVRGLDALDGTPVLDIKIYIPRYDSFPLADVPLHWCQKHSMTTTSRTLHWDTMNVSLALGMRAGMAALTRLNVSRNDEKSATVYGGDFFGQGIEAVTGCSVLDGTMDFTEDVKSLANFVATVRAQGKAVTIRVRDRLYSGADEVLALGEEHLFASIAVEP
jgi:tRNA-Thr(GGU) m(6)t(6)A37 methyltransferase TsaA